MPSQANNCLPAVFAGSICDWWTPKSQEKQT